MIWQKLARKGFKYIQKNQVEVLDKIWTLIIPYYTQIGETMEI